MMTSLAATSAPIKPGDSGGALSPTAGQVIGVPTLVAASPNGGAQALAAARPGQQVTLAITRGAQQLTVPVTLGELPGS